jgi:hypothetical protein
MKLGYVELSADDRAKLQDIVAKGRDWQGRHQAQTCYILMMG